MTLASWLVFAAVALALFGAVFWWLNRQTIVAPPPGNPTADQRIAALEAHCFNLTVALVAVGLLAMALPFALVRLGGFFGTTVWADKVVVGDTRTDYEHDMTVITNEGVSVIRVKPKPNDGGAK